MTRIKICCISSLEEANLAIQYGADALGFVGPMPSGPGIIGNDLIRKIVSKVPPEISTFLLTSESTAAGIIKHYHQTYPSVIQIVDAIELKEYQEIRKELPHVKLVQVIHVQDEFSLNESLAVSKYIDALLLDSGRPSQGILGGTGKVHNWTLSKQIVKAVQCPVFLAGGLNSSNIISAINTVKPFGVDLCSGVRTNQKLDQEKLKKFIFKVKTVNLQS